MKIVNHQDLIEKYENPILHTCNLKVGDIFLSVDEKNLMVFVSQHGQLLNRLLKI